MTKYDQVNAKCVRVLCVLKPVKDSQASTCLLLVEFVTCMSFHKHENSQRLTLLKNVLSGLNVCAVLYKILLEKAKHDQCFI